MDPAAVPRSIAKLQYAAVRLPFTLLEERVVARHRGDGAFVRYPSSRPPNSPESSGLGPAKARGEGITT